MPSKITIFLSFAVHAAAVMAIGLSLISSPVSDKESILASQLIATGDPKEQQDEPPAAPKPPESQEVQEIPPPEKAPPVEYAGAPKPSGDTADPAELEQPQEQDPESLAVSRIPLEKKALKPTPVASESELAAVADRLRENGVKAPGLDLRGVTLHTLESIAVAGQGMFIARCDDKDYSVVGSPIKPKGLIPITGKQGDWLSDRSALVSNSDSAAVRDRLLWDYGYSRDKASKSSIRFCFGNGLDRLMLLRQEQAARSLDLELSAVVSTAGRFVWNSGKVVDFQVVSVTLRDGCILKLGEASTSSQASELLGADPHAAVVWEGEPTTAPLPTPISLACYLTFPYR